MGNSLQLYSTLCDHMDFPAVSEGKESACNAGFNQVQSLGWEDPLKKGMVMLSTILAWRVPMDRGAWLAKSMRSQRVIEALGENPFLCSLACPSL